MEVGVHDAAERLGVSQQRVRQLLESGQLVGRKVAGVWLLDESELRRKRAVSRPLSERIAWGLIDVLSDQGYGFSHELAPHERYRLREKVDRLRSSDDPVSLLGSWLSRRAQRLELSCAGNDLGDLAHDARVVRSGISDERSGMSAAAELELYVLPADLEEVTAEYLLVRSARRICMSTSAVARCRNPRR
jgi:hypothetical protein